jgi:endonuclease/exonuclease/phosphatase family metal-dependent hydrolase
VHLSLESSQLTIQHFATVNKAFFAEDTTTPALLIGDYNATQGSDPINYVKNKWQDVIPNLGYTIPATGPTSQLDYVMGYPKGAWTCIKSEVLARSDMSDHCFIVADVQVTLE